MNLTRELLNKFAASMEDEIAYRICFQLSRVVLDEERKVLRILSDDPTMYTLIKESYMDKLREALEAVLGKGWDLEVLLEAQSSLDPVSDNGEHELLTYRLTPTEADLYSLNPRYTFDNFVTGRGNQFAYAAALAVAQSVVSGGEKTYNPLFIYGSSGLGKTHLLQAIGNYILKRKPETKVVYSTSEQFTNEYIEASVKRRDLERLNERYRKNVDVLLLDDIQFIEDKDKTQLALFHIFNELYERGKQIVIASDRPPKALKLLTERLRTRFESGLIVDVQPPDFETRKAILQKKLESRKDIYVHDEVLDFIAQHFRRNVRELEGALIRVIAYAEVRSVEERTVVDLDIAREALQSLLPEDSSPITPKAIKEVVARYFGITVDDLMSSRRDKKVLYPRQVAMYLMRDLLGLPYKTIGEEFGGKDHTTVMHAYQKILKGLSTQRIHDDLKNIKAILLGDKE